MKSLHKIVSYSLQCFLYLSLVWSCKPDLKNISWETDWTLPVAHGKLSLENMLSDTLVGNNQGNLFLKINQNLVQVDGLELVKIRDTALQSVFSFPLTLILTPGTTFYNKTEKIKLNLSGAEFTEAVISSGKLIIIINTTLKERSLVTFKMPCATKNGQQLMFSEWIEKSNGNAVVYSKEINLSGYELNLKGSNNQTFNELYYEVSAQTDPNGQAVPFETTDQFIIGAKFVGLKPLYAKGFLGTQNYTLTSNKVTLPFFKKIKSGQLLLNSASAKVKIINYVGAEFKLKTNYLQSVNTRQSSSVNLINNDLIGPYININRAQRHAQSNWPPVKPTQKEFVLDNQNSNLKNFIETLPDEINYGVQLEVNPFGNTSGGDDFVYFDKTFQIQMEMDIPLNFSANNLTLADTLRVGVNNLKNSNRIKEVYLNLSLENHFPLALTLKLFSVAEDGTTPPTPFSAEQTIMPGNALGAVNADIYFKIPDADLRNILKTGKILIIATFNSPAGQNTFITDSQFLAFKHKLRIVYQIQTKM